MKSRKQEVPEAILAPVGHPDHPDSPYCENLQHGCHFDVDHHAAVENPLLRSYNQAQLRPVYGFFGISAGGRA